MKKQNVSNNVIRRMPRYLRKLDELLENGTVRISSYELGRLMGFTPSQIRQDFSCFGEFGQQGYGYNVGELRAQIASILGADRNFSAVLFGVGSIGRSLMDNFCFTNCGCSLECAFDVDPALIGSEINGIPVYDMANVSDYLAENRVDIAVLCVPRAAAKKVAELLIENGVDAIWNFTNADLTEPGSPVIVENLHFSDSLLSLSYFVAEHNDYRK